MPEKFYEFDCLSSLEVRDDFSSSNWYENNFRIARLAA
jgi:hypothetical protein